MQPVQRFQCGQYRSDVAARKYVAVLAATATLKLTHGAFLTTCILAESNVKHELALKVLALH